MSFEGLLNSGLTARMQTKYLSQTIISKVMNVNNYKRHASEQ